MSQTTRLITLTPEQVQNLLNGQPIIFSNVTPAYQPNSQIIQPVQVVQPIQVQPQINPTYPLPANPSGGYPAPHNGYSNNQILPIKPPSQQPIIYNNMAALQKMYFENLICLWVTYEVLILLCIILQYVGCQSPTAANLWISIEVFLGVIGLSNYGFWNFLQQQMFKNLAFGIQLFFFILITILEIPAFALAVKYPSLIEGYANANQIGNCILYSEFYPYQIDYEGVASYILLIIYLIQFFYSAYFTFQILRKNWRIISYLRNLPPANIQQQQQHQNQVIVQYV